MGWLPQHEFDRLRNEVMALTPDQRVDLTWDQAAKYVAADTLELAYWSSLKNQVISPWEAIKRLKRIPDDASNLHE